MTLYTFPDPRRAAIDELTASLAKFPAGTTITTDLPTSLTSPRLQVAWDGTPSEERQRERAAIRVTVWTPKGQSSQANSLAALAKAVLLDASSDAVWRYTRGTGRLPGIDAATDLPFCSFTLTAETKPSAVA